MFLDCFLDQLCHPDQAAKLFMSGKYFFNLSAIFPTLLLSSFYLQPCSPVGLPFLGGNKDVMFIDKLRCNV